MLQKIDLWLERFEQQKYNNIQNQVFFSFGIYQYRMSNTLEVVEKLMYLSYWDFFLIMK